MNPLIAQIIERMSNHDGTLANAFTVNRTTSDGPEMVTGPKTETQVHPQAGARPNQSLGQHPVIVAHAGGPAETGPTASEAYARSAGGLTHTTGEKGMSMGIPPQMLQMAMQALMGGGSPQGGAPQGMPQVPGPVSPEMIMQQMQGGASPQDLIGQAGQMFDHMQVGGSPQGDDNGKPTDEEELEGVRQKMAQRDPQEYAAELKACLDDGDKKGCEAILREMEDAGMSIDDLPPNIQHELEQQGYDTNDGGDGDNGQGQEEEYE